jgi:hypothetical protein
MSKNKINFGYVIALVSLIASVFFLSPNFTGNIIGTLDSTHANFFSLILFVFGLATFLIMKKR